MAFVKNKCKIKVDTLSKLQGVSTQYSKGEISFETALDEINKIFLEAKLNKDVAMFEDAMLKTKLLDYGFEFDQENKTEKQCQIQSISHKNENLFRYRDTALLKIKGKFSHDIFKYIFLDRTPGAYMPYPTSKVDVKNNLAKFKNDLCKLIVKELNISDLEGVNFFTSKGPVLSVSGEVLYKQLMKHPAVSEFFAGDKVKLALDNPIDNVGDFDSFYAFYILNNFDQVLEDEVGALLHIDPAYKGLITNVNYLKEEQGIETEYWADDSHDAKSMKNYTSNLAKFILKQIPKVKKVGSRWVQIPGLYLLANDLYVLGHIIKQAEFEYNLKYKKDPVVLALDTMEGFRKLINATDLPVYKNAKKFVVDSIRYFLYNESEAVDAPKSIKSLFKDNFDGAKKILDIETLIAFEATLSIAPCYSEFDPDGTPDHRNYGGVYRGGDVLKTRITEFLLTLLQLKKSAKSKSVFKSDIQNLRRNLNPETDSELITFISTAVLGFDSSSKDEYMDFAAKNIEKFTLLTKELATFVFGKPTSKANVLEAAKKAIEQEDWVETYTKLLEIADTIIGTLKDKVNKGDGPSFVENYSSIISDAAMTLFTSYADTELPTYRLQSAITMDSWFMYQYKKSMTGLGTTYLEGLNFLVDNPTLFSGHNTTSIGKNSSKNPYYKGSTSYLVDFGNVYKNSTIAELSPADLMQILFLNNIDGIESYQEYILSKDERQEEIHKNLFHFLPVCYSDKSSIGVKTLNLAAQIIYVGDDGESHPTTLREIIDSYKDKPEEVIHTLRLIDYRQRKNSLLILINSILKKWAKLAKLKGVSENIIKTFSPLSDSQLGLKYWKMETVLINGVSKPLYDVMLEKVNALNNFFDSKTFNLKEYYVIASLLNEDLIDELDYVKKPSPHFNTAILYDFQQLKTFETFSKSLDQSFERFKLSKEVGEMIESMKDHLKMSKKDSIYYRSLCEAYPDSNDNKLELYFVLKKVKRQVERDGKVYQFTDIEYELKVDTESGNIPLFSTMKVFAALSNLGRHAYLDMVSKFYYLDPDKKESSCLDNPFLGRAHRIDAMAKRMVLYPATIQLYAQGKFDGVSQEAKVAIIEDPAELTWNITGDTHDQDIFDGSGFLSPFWSMMEDNSLPGHGVNGTKKTLGTSTIGHNSTLFKWAGFPITNEKMRFSMKLLERLNGKLQYSLLKLFKKMHDIKFTEDIDITRNFKGDYMDSPFSDSVLGKHIYIREGFNFKKIDSIEKVPGINLYLISYTIVNGEGKEVLSDIKESKTIDSIYTLWETLGGINSYELIDGHMQESEASIEATFKYIVNVGVMDDTASKEGVYTQSHIKLPLRDKFIAIAANKSAVKRGAANLNSAEDAWQSDNSLNNMTINTSCFGVLLDANHHSDMADVREMSQTISALAALGYTADLAELAYESIADLVKIALNKTSKYLKASENLSMQEALAKISRSIIAALAREEKIASVDAFIDMFTDEANVTILPVSDRRFYKTFIKEILGELNKSAIRRRYTGLGGILNPASNIMQLYEVNGTPMSYQDLLRDAVNFFSINEEEHTEFGDKPEYKEIFESESFIQFAGKEIQWQEARTDRDYLETKWLVEQYNLLKERADALSFISANTTENPQEVEKKKERIKEINLQLLLFNLKKDRDIINLYLRLKGSSSLKASIALFESEKEVTRIIPQTSNLRIIKPLDTVHYTIYNPDGTIKEDKIVCLDTLSKQVNFWKTVEENWDWRHGKPNDNFKVRLCVDRPHDLRPQNIYWETKRVDVDSEDDNAYYTTSHNVYTTKVARLGTTFGKIKKHKLKTEKMLSELESSGLETQESCNI